MVKEYVITVCNEDRERIKDVHVADEPTKDEIAKAIDETPNGRGAYVQEFYAMLPFE